MSQSNINAVSIPTDYEAAARKVRSISPREVDIIAEKLLLCTKKSTVFEPTYSSNDIYNDNCCKTPGQIKKKALKVILNNLSNNIIPTPIEANKLSIEDELVNSFAHSIESACFSFQLMYGRDNADLPIFGHALPFAQEAMGEIAVQMKDFVKTIMYKAEEIAQEHLGEGPKAVQSYHIRMAASQFKQDKAIKDSTHLKEYGWEECESW